MKSRIAPFLLGALLWCGASAGRAAAPPPTMDIAACDNALACDLYGRLRATPHNVFFSPFSTLVALSMAQAGAAGATADEMARVLHLPGAEPHAGMARMLGDLTHREKVQLNIADRLFVDGSETLVPGFLTLTATNYGAAAAREDFVHAAETSRQDINHWVDGQTEHHIKELMRRGSVGPSTRVVLVNAVLFKGDWKQPFEAARTRPGPFAGAAGDVTIPFMYGEKDCLSAKLDGAEILSLPYHGDLSLVVLLPDGPRASGLERLEAGLTAERWTQWREQLGPDRRFVAMPRFTDAWSADLRPTLQQLGMRLAFSNGDFSGMTRAHTLAIDTVEHEAWVDVNETGTVAAAATSAGMRGTSAPEEFKADHPFVYAIVDDRSGAILFLGRFLEPH